MLSLNWTIICTITASICIGKLTVTINLIHLNDDKFCSIKNGHIYCLFNCVKTACRVQVTPKLPFFFNFSTSQRKYCRLLEISPCLPVKIGIHDLCTSLRQIKLIIMALNFSFKTICWFPIFSITHREIAKSSIIICIVLMRKEKTKTVPYCMFVHWVRLNMNHIYR